MTSIFKENNNSNNFMVQLKANSPKDSTNAIVISFDSKWKNAISMNSFSVVFRKRGPKSLDLDWIYFYVSAPDSSIIGRGKIDKYESMSINNALRLCGKAGLTPAELQEYAEGYDSLAVFTLSTIEPATKPMRLAQLAANFAFKPPQSFVIMSVDGKEELDIALGF